MDRRAAAEAAWAAQRVDLAKTIVDYAYWDEAAERLGAGDAEWAAANIGQTAYDTFGWSFTAALDPSGEVTALFERGVAVDAEERPDLVRVLSRLSDRALRAKPGKPTPVIEPARLQGELLLIAVAAVTPSSPDKAAATPAGRRATLMMARRFDADALDKIAAAYRLPDLRDDAAIDSERAAANAARLSLAIADSDGVVCGALSWRFEPPGRRLLVSEAPFLLLLALAVGAIGWASARQTARLAADRAGMIRNLRAARRDAAAADRTKTQFLSLISHELFTPLNGVIGFAELIRIDQHASREQVDHYAGVVLERAQKLHQLITDLVAAAAFDPLAPHPPLERCDLLAEVKDAALNASGRAAENGVSITCAGRGGAVPCDANLDALRQALRRLIEQAVHVSPADESVMLTVATSADDARILIEDHGPPLSLELISAFERPFSFDSAALQRGDDGFALNLFIARGLVIAAGGRLSLEAGAGGGMRACLSFTLPGRNGDDVSERFDDVAGLGG